MTNTLFDLPTDPRPDPVTDPVQARREERGAIDALFAQGRAFVRKASLGPCPTCRQPVLTGIDDAANGWPVTVDPTPLSPHQELAATMADRPTYSLRISTDRVEINDRDRYALCKPHPTGRPIVPAHRCGARFPTHLQQWQTRARPSSPDDAPPF